MSCPEFQSTAEKFRDEIAFLCEVRANQRTQIGRLHTEIKDNLDLPPKERPFCRNCSLPYDVDRATKMISCAERLPEKAGDYLIYCTSDPFEMLWRIGHYEPGLEAPWTYGIPGYGCEPTHWQLLPDAPEEPSK